MHFLPVISISPELPFHKNHPDFYFKAHGPISFSLPQELWTLNILTCEIMRSLLYDPAKASLALKFYRTMKLSNEDLSRYFFLN